MYNISLRKGIVGIMKTIRVSNLKIGETIGVGSYAHILECKYKEQNYAYKAFLKPQKVLNESRKRKLTRISQLDLKGSVLPQFWVKDGFVINGYLMDLYSNVFLEELEPEDRINCLRNLKTSILELHENKIIHGDIHEGNIIYDETSAFLVDFDNSAYKNKGINYEMLNINAKNFVTTYGLTKDLDIFLFNVLTYSLFTDIDYYSVINEIPKCSSHGIFDEFDCSDIIKSLTLKEKNFNNDFLIDRIK